MENRHPCNALHLVKLCAGADRIEDLEEWQAHLSSRRREAGLDPSPTHVTRMWPRREGEIVPGGSLYWVIKGLILVRQEIARFEEAVGEDGVRRCAIVLKPGLVRTEARPRKPFQGWRYLSAADAPPDLSTSARRGAANLPPEMRRELDALGVRVA